MKTFQHKKNLSSLRVRKLGHTQKCDPTQCSVQIRLIYDATSNFRHLPHRLSHAMLLMLCYTLLSLPPTVFWVFPFSISLHWKCSTMNKRSRQHEKGNRTEQVGKHFIRLILFIVLILRGNYSVINSNCSFATFPSLNMKSRGGEEKYQSGAIRRWWKKFARRTQDGVRFVHF